MSATPTSRGVTGSRHRLTVTGQTRISPHYLRLHFDAGALLSAQSEHAGMRIAGRFPDGESSHQRGYTLVNPDAVAGTVDIDFALHDGPGARWASGAVVGDVLEVTMLSGGFELPRTVPEGYIIVGDAASLPAVNSVLDAIGDTPASVFLEAGHDDDRDLPVHTDRGDVDVIWVDRAQAGQGLVDAVRQSAFHAPRHFGWVACDNRTTRSVAKVFREQYAIPRRAIKAQAYRAA